MPKLSADLNDLLTRKHVLLLQGKMGSFFSRFATYLKQHNIRVSKVNFNAGDAYFYQHKPAYNFTDTFNTLDTWLEDLIEANDFDAVVCFGDCRPHHLIAKNVLDTAQLPLYVFEEGYLRPDYITLEKHGVNGFSQLDTSVLHTLSHQEQPLAPVVKKNERPQKIHTSFIFMTLVIIQYYAICYLSKARFPHYRHYRGLTVWQEAASWLRGFSYGFLENHKDHALQRKLTNQQDNNYFLVTLQVHNDFQISHHSDYQDIIEFITDVIDSFARHADAAQHIVFKHHPMDRGHRHYGRLIKQLSEQHGIRDRVHYGCDMHLPSMIKHSLGMITINSTTGLQSLYHGKPVLVMSPAVYNTPELTTQCTLDEFWHNQGEVNMHAYYAFRQLLLDQNQLNGSFYGDAPWMEVNTSSSKLNTSPEHDVSR